ncbi:hypothetical protein ACFLWO_00645 [Chloroflexota bacterium]
MLEMTKDKRDKLRRYLINADPFFWNVLNMKNKKGRIQELKEMGFLADYSDSANVNYSRINQDLLVALGIEGILERIIVPKVTSLFTADIIDYFRRCWEEGQTPTLDYLRKQGLYRRRYRAREVYESHWHYEEPPSGYKDPSFVFLQIETQHNFVERWTVFAGLWFEEIEPLFVSTGLGTSEKGIDGKL